MGASDSIGGAGARPGGTGTPGSSFGGGGFGGGFGGGGGFSNEDAERLFREMMGGMAGGGIASYATPEEPDGREFPVTRFAGNNGLAISGDLGTAAFDLTVTPGACSDGMSDRTYPFTATLLIGNEQRQGCAWTDSQPFTGPERP